jgi:hypothetical protein
MHDAVYKPWTAKCSMSSNVPNGFNPGHIEEENNKRKLWQNICGCFVAANVPSASTRKLSRRHGEC